MQNDDIVDGKTATKSRCRDEATYFRMTFPWERQFGVHTKCTALSPFCLSLRSSPFSFFVRISIFRLMYERWQDRSHHHRHQPAIIANNNNCKRHYDIMSYVINAIHMCAVLVRVLDWWDTGICERYRSRRLFIIIIVISFIHLFFPFYLCTKW